MDVQSERLLTPDEVAELLKVSRFRVYELGRTGALPAVRLGRQVRFNPAVLRAFIESGGRALEGDGGWGRAVGE